MRRQCRYHDDTSIFMRLRTSSENEVFNTLDMIRYSRRLTIMPNQLMIHMKRALFCLLQGLQLLYGSKDELRNLLNLYIINAIALLSVYSSYLPTPLKVAWLILSCYYRRAFEYVLLVKKIKHLFLELGTIDNDSKLFCSS